MNAVHVLVVENDFVINWFVQESIRKCSPMIESVDSANSFEEAKKKLTAHNNYHLICLDYDLGNNQTGVDLTDFIDIDQKIVFITATPHAITDEILQLGNVMGVIEKPLSEKECKNMIEEILRDI